MAKVHAAYSWAQGFPGRLVVVFAHERDAAEWELGLLRHSGAARVGITARKERPGVIARELLHRFPGASLMVARYARAGRRGPGRVAERY